MTSTGPGRLWLASLSPVARLITTAAWLVCVVGWCAVLILAASVMDVPGASALFFIELVFAVLTSIPLTIILVEAYSFGAWVEGTEVVVRHCYGVRRWDLSSATVAVQSTPGKAWIAVRDEKSGRRVRLRLRGPGLRHAGALAEVIAATRPGDPAARQAAEALARAVR